MGVGEIEFEHGAVTFLDVLGWKGIWQQNRGAIKVLHQIVEETKKTADTLSQNFLDERPEYRGRPIKTDVLSISDTIAMFTSGDPKTSIEIHAKVCAWLLPYAMNQHIPLRGAISFGDYITQDNIMLGYAVDEAASWHETTDWIGVILTPSAQMKLQSANIQIDEVIEYPSIPFKLRERNLKKCVKWTFSDRNKLIEIIDKKGPHTPDIAPKYLNTLAFLQESAE